MQAVVEATGGVKSADILKQSWRSRSDLVNACNAIFKRAFKAAGEKIPFTDSAIRKMILAMVQSPLYQVT